MNKVPTIDDHQLCFQEDIIETGVGVIVMKRRKGCDIPELYANGSSLGRGFVIFGGMNTDTTPPNLRQLRPGQATLDSFQSSSPAHVPHLRTTAPPHVTKPRDLRPI